MKKRMVKKRKTDTEEKKKTREKDKERERVEAGLQTEGATFVGQSTQKQSPRAKRGKRRGKIVHVYMYIYCIAM